MPHDPISRSPRQRVIVVDDDEATRKLVCRQLSAAGYTVSSFPDGRSALRPICEMGTGVVIADWAMPEMDGPELCRALRELHEMQALGNIYFIMLTAHNTKEKVVEGLEAGANDYLTKPYHHGELLARVQVGERMLCLQDEVVRHTVELQKANAGMALLNGRLEQLANTDVLTRLPNRRCLFTNFEEAWEQSGRGAQPLCCIMLDVDHFKRVNDVYGHAAGDQVLQTVAECIRRNARRPELCGRFGGEEFLLILPTLTLRQAVRLAEDLRCDVSRSTICVGTETIRVSVSCGVAERQPEDQRPDDLIRQADQMLYMAKEHGRNQTWVAGADGTGRVARDLAAASVTARVTIQ